LFVRLLDYSKDMESKPGMDATVHEMYVVTELAEYNLKELIAKRREQGKPLSNEMVHTLSKEMVIVVAGLHAKGFVHLDLKPENLMMCSGHLKLIDVDGCARVGSTVSMSNGSISYSPCYCAPEWAQFLLDENELPIKISAGLDVWSVGMTICELVTQEVLMTEKFKQFVSSASNPMQGAYCYMEWLSNTRDILLPECIQSFDAALYDVLKGSMLVSSKFQRKNLAECLSAPYFAGTSSPHTPRPPQVEEQLEQQPCGDASADIKKHACRCRHRTLSRKMLLQTLWPM